MASYHRVNSHGGVSGQKGEYTHWLECRDDDFLERVKDLNVGGLFFETACRCPDRIAVATSEGVTLYRELACGVNEWRLAFRELELKKGETILLCADKPLVIIECMLACLAEGLVYVVQEADTPTERIKTVMEDICPAALVGNPRVETGQCPIVSPMKKATGSLPVEAKGGLAYVAYTSGTSGKPKGVMLAHANIVNEVRCHVKALGTTATDRFSGLYSLSTVGAVRDVFTALLTGACYCPFQVKGKSWSAFSTFCVEQRLTVLHAVPPVFRSWLASVKSEQTFSSVRTVFLAGDAVRSTDVILARNHIPQAGFYTGLGASESSSLYVHGFILGDDITHSTVLPSGKPFPFVEVVLVDSDDVEVCTHGMEGEIVVSSPFLALGYWNDPEQTRTKFKTDVTGRKWYHTGDRGRFDTEGHIYHLGRVDRQIKINGVRIEPAEVELALRSHPMVRDVHLNTYRFGTTGERLVAYVVPNEAMTDEVLYTYLKDRLPLSHMPACFIWLEKLPLNANGKVSRMGLPTPEHLTANSGGSGNIGKLFAEVLSRRGVAEDIDFRLLGGDSLLMVHLATELHRQYGLVPPASFWQGIVSVHTVEALLSQGYEQVTPSVWPAGLWARAKQWEGKTSLTPSNTFPGHFREGEKALPVLIWLVQSPAEYVLLAPHLYAGSVWAMVSPYPVLSTSESELERWLPRALEGVVKELEGREVIVGGYCGSGSIAILLADILKKRGVKVVSALVLEAFGTLGSSRRFFWGYATWLNTFQQLRKSPISSWWGVGSAKIRRFKAKYGPKGEKGVGTKVMSPASVSTTRRHPFMLKETPAFAGPLHLVVSQGTWRWRFLYPGFGWSRQRFPKLILHRVKGTHFNLMNENTPANLLSPGLNSSTLTDDTPRTLPVNA